MYRATFGRHPRFSGAVLATVLIGVFTLIGFGDIQLFGNYSTVAPAKNFLDNSTYIVGWATAMDASNGVVSLLWIGLPSRTAAANESSSLWFQHLSPAPLPIQATLVPKSPNGLGGDVRYSYPFDTYSTNVMLFEVKDNHTGNRTRISGVALLDVALGWDMHLQLVDENGVAEDDSDYYDSGGDRLGRYQYFYITVNRNLVTRAFAVLVAIVNWLLTLVTVWVTIVAGFGPRTPTGDYNVRGELLALPITVLLGIPALRAAMPGDPPSGSRIDLWGYYPNLVIVITSAVWLVALITWK
ncbi:hypothetical protein RQP46_002467 [Phenoliferia psychrophenolica]